MVLAIKNPADAYTLSAFLDPLKALSWLAIITFCFILPVFLIGTTRSYLIFLCTIKALSKIGYIPRYGSHDGNNDQFTWSKSFALTLQATVMSKGWKGTPGNLSARIVFIRLVITPMYIQHVMNNFVTFSRQHYGTRFGYPLALEMQTDCLLTGANH